MRNKLSLYILLLISLFIGNSAYAAPNSNGTITNWNTGSGWTPSGMPNLILPCAAIDIVVSHNENSGSILITNGNSVELFFKKTK